MNKINKFVIPIFTIIFIGSISLYFININKIKNNKIESQSLKIQLESLKDENKALLKINTQLLEENSIISKKVNSLKNSID